MNLGKAIKVVRVMRGLTQEELANLADLSVSYISLLERNKCDPAWSVVMRIAYELNINPITFIALAETRTGLSKELLEKLSEHILRELGE
jgi:transcriptional regulator with XRE-family HTH domain